ncbi:MAG: flagellar biosynthetic protein FliQ [Phycisphaerae bacterium]
MTGDLVLYLGRRTMETAMLVASPVLLVALIVGFITALIQAITSIRDMTMGMVLKLAGIGITLLLFGSWMLSVLMEFTTEVFNTIGKVGP